MSGEEEGPAWPLRGRPEGWGKSRICPPHFVGGQVGGHGRGTWLLLLFSVLRAMSPESPHFRTKHYLYYKSTLTPLIKFTTQILGDWGDIACKILVSLRNHVPPLCPPICPPTKWGDKNRPLAYLRRRSRSKSLSAEADLSDRSTCSRHHLFHLIPGRRPRARTQTGRPNRKGAAIAAPFLFGRPACVQACGLRPGMS